MVMLELREFPHNYNACEISIESKLWAPFAYVYEICSHAGPLLKLEIYFVMHQMRHSAIFLILKSWNFPEIQNSLFEKDLN